HLRVRDRHRTTSSDLPQKCRNYAASTAKHIAKANGYEVPIVFDRRVLHDQLGHPLRRSHDACWPYRLVGRNENKMLACRLQSCVGDVQRTENVISDRFNNVLLHQRDMLMSGGVKYGVRPMLSENRRDPLAIAHIGDYWRHGDVGIRATELV